MNNSICTLDLANLWLIARTPAAAGDCSTLIIGAVVAAVIVGIAGGVWYALQRKRKQRNGFSHSALFDDLCRVHGLDRASRRLLKQVVQHCRLAQPGRVFVEPRWLDPATLSEPLRSKPSELTALRERIFGAA